MPNTSISSTHLRLSHKSLFGSSFSNHHVNKYITLSVFFKSSICCFLKISLDSEGLKFTPNTHNLSIFKCKKTPFITAGTEGLMVKMTL